MTTPMTSDHILSQRRACLGLAFLKAFLVYTALQCLMESDAFMRGYNAGRTGDFSGAPTAPWNR